MSVFLDYTHENHGKIQHEKYKAVAYGKNNEYIQW